MSEGYALILLLCLLYLCECFLFIRRSSVAFVAPWGRHWKVAVPSSLFSGLRGSLIVLNPLLALGRVYVCHLSPISISPHGVCAFNPQSLLQFGRPEQTNQVLGFDEITSCSADGKSLNINNGRFADCGDSEQAVALASLINSAVGVSAGERESVIRRFIAGRVDMDAVLRQLSSETACLNVLRISCSLFFLVLFLVVPALVTVYGLERLIIPSALMMFVFAGHISVLFFRIHRRLYPELKGERLSHLTKMLFCPPGAIRAPDILTASLVANYDPAVVASTLSSPQTDEFVHSYLRDLKYPIKDELTDSFSSKIVVWYRAQLLDCVHKHLHNAGFQIDFRGPKLGEESASYCPRCLGQFEINGGECVDCPGVALIPAWERRLEVQR